MREIKFRGRTVNGEWVYGNLIGTDVIVGDITEWDDQYFCTEFWYKVESETVGQFTGIKDKNGNEIYDGDILQDHSGVGEVEWVQEQCQFVVFARVPESVYIAFNSDGVLTNTEVIGNVHDNPELRAGGAACVG